MSGNPSKHIIDYIEDISNYYPDNIAIIEEETNRKISYYELMNRADSVNKVLNNHINYPKSIIKGELIYYHNS